MRTWYCVKDLERFQRGYTFSVGSRVRVRLYPCRMSIIRLAASAAAEKLNFREIFRRGTASAVP